MKKEDVITSGIGSFWCGMKRRDPVNISHLLGHGIPTLTSKEPSIRSE